jgi:hypothetical protein
LDLDIPEVPQIKNVAIGTAEINRPGLVAVLANELRVAPHADIYVYEKFFVPVATLVSMFRVRAIGTNAKPNTAIFDFSLNFAGVSSSISPFESWRKHANGNVLVIGPQDFITACTKHAKLGDRSIVMSPADKAYDVGGYYIASTTAVPGPLISFLAKSDPRAGALLHTPSDVRVPDGDGIMEVIVSRAVDAIQSTLCWFRWRCETQIDFSVFKKPTVQMVKSEWTLLQCITCILTSKDQGLISSAEARLFEVVNVEQSALAACARFYSSRMGKDRTTLHLWQYILVAAVTFTTGSLAYLNALISSSKRGGLYPYKTSKLYHAGEILEKGCRTMVIFGVPGPNVVQSGSTLLIEKWIGAADDLKQTKHEGRFYYDASAYLEAKWR